MKKYVLLILVFTTIIMLRGTAQVTVTITPNAIASTVNPDSFEIKGKATFKNTSSATKKFTWVRNILSIASGWQALVCDNKSCWSSTVGTAPEQIELAPNGTSNLDVYIRPSGKGGTASVEVRVSEVGNDANAATAKYTFSSTTSTKDVKNTTSNVRIYPNPATDYFMLMDNNDAVDRVVIYNIIGRQVRSYKAVDGTKYTVNDLPEGLYIIRLLNGAGTTVKTVRLNKTRIRA
jgi:Secretion system C-terminal sorting domain